MYFQGASNGNNKGNITTETKVVPSARKQDDGDNSDTKLRHHRWVRSRTENHTHQFVHTPLISMSNGTSVTTEMVKAAAESDFFPVPQNSLGYLVSLTTADKDLLTSSATEHST